MNDAEADCPTDGRPIGVRDLVSRHGARPRRRLPGRVPVLALVAALLVLGPGWLGAPATAHTALRQASPGPGDTVRTGATLVSLTFGDDLDRQALSSISMQGPQGRALQVGQVEMVDRNTLCARTEPLPSGKVVLTYRTTSADGHPVQGRYAFAVAPSGAPVEPGPCAGVELAAPDDRPVSIEAGSDAVPDWLVPVSIGLALVAAALGGGVLRRRERG